MTFRYFIDILNHRQYQIQLLHCIISFSGTIDIDFHEFDYFEFCQIIFEIELNSRIDDRL